MVATASTIAPSGRHRLLGGLALAGGVGYVIAGIVMSVTADPSNLAVDVLSLLWALGCICGLVGIGMLGVAGRGAFGRIALTLATLAYVVAALDALLIMVGAYGVETSPLFAISRIGTLVGMLLLGIATVATGGWPGWRRFAPFAVPLAMPLTFALAAATGVAPIVPLVGLAWVLIGYAVVSSPAAS